MLTLDKFADMYQAFTAETKSDVDIVRLCSKDWEAVKKLYVPFEATEERGFLGRIYGALFQIDGNLLPGHFRFSNKQVGYREYVVDAESDFAMELRETSLIPVDIPDTRVGSLFSRRV